MFDIVLCDPPTLFNTSGGKMHNNDSGGLLSCNKHYDVLARAAVEAVKPGGKLLLFCNSQSLKYGKWFEMVEKGLGESNRRFQCIGNSSKYDSDSPTSLLYSVASSDDFTNNVEGRTVELDLKCAVFHIE